MPGYGVDKWRPEPGKQTIYDRERGKILQWYANPQQAFGHLGASGVSVRAQFANGGGAYIEKDWKPREAAKQTQRRSRGLASYALNAGQGLAGVGDSVPILFGQRTASSGGLVATPDAVYQRMHSAGLYEWLRAAYVVGEGGFVLNTPPDAGIRLGNRTIASIGDNYYSFGTTDGATANNDPSLATVQGMYGAFKSFTDLAGNNEYLTGTINGSEERCFSQTFGSDQSFGFSGEEPDCESEALPTTQSITSVPLNKIEAFVANTRSCEVTEIGLAPSLNATSGNKDDVAPPGSLWTTAFGTQVTVYRVVSIAAYISNTYPRSYRSDLANTSILDSQFAKQQEKWNNGARFLMALDASTLLPSENGWVRTINNFTNNIGALYFPYTGDTRNRNTAPACGYALPTPDPCKPPSFQLILSDPNNPKMAFDVYWRSVSGTTASWRRLTQKPLIIATADSTVAFSSLKIQHPSLAAYQFKLVPLLPDEFARDWMQFDEFLFEGNISHQAQSRGSFPILYGRNANQVVIDGFDGFKLTFLGGIAPFYGDVTLDDKTVNYTVGLNYVNEVIRDAPDYPFMSVAVASLRGYKGFSTGGALSVYYDNGADISLVDGSVGPSNMFPDLAHYVLTTFPGSTTGAVPLTAIDIQSFQNAITFTRSRGLFFDGVIEEKSGAFEFIADHAPYFLLNFGMNRGQYSLTVATQDSSTGKSTASSNQVLTLEDIVAESYQVEYASLVDREDAIVNVTYRHQERFMLGEERTVTVAPSTYTGSNVLFYNLSSFCTTAEHAATYGKYVLATRTKKTHTVQFTTFIGRIDLAPGRLFKFNFSVTTSTGETYTNNSQYQIVSAQYRQDGLVDVQATVMPDDFASSVFGNTYRVEL